VTAELPAFPGIERGIFGVICADPPWSFKTYSAKGNRKGPAAQYDCMPLAAIQALPVASVAAPDCACIMWATAPMLPQAIATMTAWGFAYKSAGAWAKQSSTGRKWHFGTGYCYRSAVEFWLLGTRGKPVQRARNVRNLIVAPVRGHSRKPDAMRRQIEAMWLGPYIELFARNEGAEGWTAWGNEVGKFEAPERLLRLRPPEQPDLLVPAA
jgi:N6-adenosine-specific RNA methylase IME4